MNDISKSIMIDSVGKQDIFFGYFVFLVEFFMSKIAWGDIASVFCNGTGIFYDAGSWAEGERCKLSTVVDFCLVVF